MQSKKPIEGGHIFFNGIFFYLTPAFYRSRLLLIWMDTNKYCSFFLIKLTVNMSLVIDRLILK